MNGHHRLGLRLGQRLAQRQLQRRETFIAQFLGELHHARLADAGQLSQLLRAEMARLLGVIQQKVRQLAVVCASVGYIWRMRRRVLIVLSLETSGHFAMQRAKTRGENFVSSPLK